MLYLVTIIICFVLYLAYELLIKDVINQNNEKKELLKKAKRYTPTPTKIYECPRFAKNGEEKELFIVDNTNKIVFINSHKYNYTQIKDYSEGNDYSIYLVDNIKYRYETTGYKKDTKNAIGRAVVGGVLAGGVGAIIGGATAKTKETRELVAYSDGKEEMKRNDSYVIVRMADYNTETIILHDDYLQLQQVKDELDRIINESKNS